MNSLSDHKAIPRHTILRSDVRPARALARRSSRATKMLREDGVQEKAAGL